MHFLRHLRIILPYSAFWDLFAVFEVTMRVYSYEYAAENFIQGCSCHHEIQSGLFVCKGKGL